MSVLAWIGIVLGGVVALLAALLLIDAVIGRAFLSGGIYSTLGRTDKRALVVYLPGILADGVDSSVPLVDTWKNYADVLQVSYTGELFEPDYIVGELHRRLTALQAKYDYNNIVFVLSSMGGFLGMDLMSSLRKSGMFPLWRVTLFFVDSPSGAKDMLGGGNIVAPALRFLPFGPIFNKLVGPIMRRTLVPPKDENIESHLNAEDIKRKALEMMRAFPLSVWRDELVYMATHAPFTAEDFEDLKEVVYFRCDRDNETVKQPNAASTWWKWSGGRADVVGVDSPHCGYLERENTWNTLFDEELRLVAWRRL